MNLHLASTVAPAARLVVASAPSVHAAFDRGQRIERQPGAVYAEPLAGLLGADRLTDQREHEGLGDAHDRERVVRVPDGMHITVGTDHAHAEQIAGRLGERRVDIRVASFTA